jgi:hypothetical protein
VTGVGGWGGAGALLISGGGILNSQTVPSWKGLVDDVRIYSGVLDPVQIVDDMHTRASGS